VEKEKRERKKKKNKVEKALIVEAAAEVAAEKDDLAAKEESLLQRAGRFLPMRTLIEKLEARGLSLLGERPELQRRLKEHDGRVAAAKAASLARDPELGDVDW